MGVGKPNSQTENKRKAKGNKNQIKRQINVTKCDTTVKGVGVVGVKGRGCWQDERTSQGGDHHKRRPQNGCLKTQLHNNLFTFFHTPSTLKEPGAAGQGG